MTKNQLYIVGVLCVLLNTKAFCQQDISANNKSLLWQISAKNLEKPSYLFGTMHSICKDDYIWTVKMKEALANSEEVCFEMDLSDTSMKSKLKYMLIDTSGKKLEDYFTPEDYGEIARYLKDMLKVDIAKLQMMKPIALLTMVSLKMSQCKEREAYEKNIMKAAKAQGEKISGLETIEDQMNLMQKTPNDTIIKALINIAKNKMNLYSRYRILAGYYRQQDLPALYKMMGSSMSVDNMDMMLNERNEKWITQMPGKMDHKSVFFAVGAGHLWGEKGLIQLLKNQGYTMVPLYDTVNIAFFAKDTGVRNYVEKMPKAGYDVNKYLAENLDYPKKARKKNIEGRVLIKFVVNEDGSISDCTVIRGIGGGCDEEALRVVKNLPPWNPAMQDGKPVRVYFQLPIVFKLEN